MGTGYVRNDSGNNIADGNVINASDLDGEFDAIAATLATSGHTHDGTAAEGAPVTVLGPTQDFVATASVIRPKTDNTLDIGTASLEFKDLFIDGTAHIDVLDVDETASITGVLTTTAATVHTGGITMPDSAKAIFGAGSDLQIYHDGSKSIIRDAGVGDMQLWVNDLKVYNAAGTTALLTLFDTGATNLGYAGAFKLATTATGIDVTGTILADGLNLDGNIQGDNGQNMIVSAGEGSGDKLDLRAGDDVRIWVDGFNAHQKAAEFANNGDISFYEDSGTTPKFFWDASAESLGIGTSSPTQKLDITTAGTTRAFIRNTNLTSSGMYVGEDGTGQQILGLGAYPMRFSTNGSEAMRIGASGKVGIGTTSPAYPLHVIGSARIELTGGATSADFDITSGATWRFRSNPTTGTNSYGLDIIKGSAGTNVKMSIDSSGNVGIGTTSPSATLHVNVGTNVDNVSAVLIEGTNAGSATTPDLSLYHNSSSPADGDYVGALWFYGNNSAAEQTAYAGIFGLSEDVTNATEDGAIGFVTTRGGSVATEAMRIDGSGNVGIGTDSPSSRLHVKPTVDSTNGGLRLESADGSEYATIDMNNAGNLRFYQNGTPIMRLDSSGNLLVGTTSTSLFDGDEGEGFSYRAGNEFTVARASAAPVTFVRQTDDGTIVSFKKDTANVGSIGARSGDLFLASGDQGVRIRGSVPEFIPTGAGGGTDSNGEVDLGGDGRAWRNLFLSGGVYLGGTGAANLLDDYETGTFTMGVTFATTEPTAGPTEANGYYVKTGNICTIWLHVNNINVTGGAGDLRLNNSGGFDGLPFVSRGTGVTGQGQYMGPVTINNCNVGSTTTQINSQQIDGVNYVRFTEQIDNGATDVINVDNCTHGVTDITFSMTYPVA